MRVGLKRFLKYCAGAAACFALGAGVAAVFGGSDLAQPVAQKSASATPTSTPEANLKSDKGDARPPEASQDKPSAKPGQTYTVRSGDTLSTISSQFGVTVAALAEYNNIPEPYNLSIGQELIIPQ